MLTIGKVAKLLDVPISSVRNWLNVFPEFFSSSALPPKGQVKLLDDSDIEVLWTIKALRERKQTTESIRASLAAGDRIIPAAEEEAGSNDESRAVLALSAAAALWEGKAVTLEEERDTLREQLDQEREERLQLERDLAATKAKLEQKSKGFWARVFNR